MAAVKRRQYQRWRAAEDRALLAHDPSTGETLRELAARLGRTYYACRIRRKALRSGTLSPGQRSACTLCSRPLPEGRKPGHCTRCKRAVAHEAAAAAHRRTLEETLPTASRRHRLWTAEEDAEVLARPPDVEMAKRLGRTVGSCQLRRFMLRTGRATPGGTQQPHRGGGREPVEECKHGHPFDKANTYTDSRGHRGCRECLRRRAREYRARQRARRLAEAAA